MMRASAVLAVLLCAACQTQQVPPPADTPAVAQVAARTRSAVAGEGRLVERRAQAEQLAEEHWQHLGERARAERADDVEPHGVCRVGLGPQDPFDDCLWFVEHVDPADGDQVGVMRLFLSRLTDEECLEIRGKLRAWTKARDEAYLARSATESRADGVASQPAR